MTTPDGLIVCLDDATTDSLIGPVEVMVHEGLTTFSLPVGCEALGEVKDIYGSRASFGVHGVLTPDELRRAAELDALFALTDDANDDLFWAAGELELPVYLSAMTPTEVRHVVQHEGAGVHLFPADVVGQTMAEHLRGLGMIERVIPRGGLGAFAAGEWLKAGAQAVCVDETLVGNALSGGDLGQLRDRCTSFVSVQRQHTR